MSGKPSSTNPTSNDSRHSQLYWRCRNLSRVNWCHLHWHHSGAMFHSLLQLPPEKVMQFQVTEIEFDFTTDDGEYELQPSRQEQIIDETIGQIWEADDEDDLVEEITCATGWCIKSIDYRIILK